MYLNKAYIIGNLTRDAEGKTLPSGTQVTNFSVATNRYWNENGERKEQTEYHNVIAYGKLAEFAATLKKADKVLIEGRLQTRSWETDDGSKKYRTEVIADVVQRAEL